jgi:hypothetical protein
MAPDWHAVFYFLFSTTTPRREKIRNRHSKDFGEKENLRVAGDAALGFYTGKHVSGHAAPEHLELRDSRILRPLSLIAEPRHVPADKICVASHALSGWPSVNC